MLYPVGALIQLNPECKKLLKDYNDCLWYHSVIRITGIKGDMYQCDSLDNRGHCWVFYDEYSGIRMFDPVKITDIIYWVE